jgi:hypothetical protein
MLLLSTESAMKTIEAPPLCLRKQALKILLSSLSDGSTIERRDSVKEGVTILVGIEPAEQNTNN